MFCVAFKALPRANEMKITFTFGLGKRKLLNYKKYEPRTTVQNPAFAFHFTWLLLPWWSGRVGWLKLIIFEKLVQQMGGRIVVVEKFHLGVTDFYFNSFLSPARGKVRQMIITRS